MKKIVVVILLSFIGLTVFGQSNPFDIKSDQKTNTTVQNTSSISENGTDGQSVLNNPFDIQYNSTEITVDSDASVSNLQQDEIDTSKVVSNNPFDIVAPVHSISKDQSVTNSVVDQKETSTSESKPEILSFYGEWLKKPFVELKKLILLTMLLASVLLAIVLNLERDALSKALQSATNTNIMRLNFRNSMHESKGYLRVLSLIDTLSMAVFIYFIVKYQYGLDDLKILLLVLALVFAIKYIKKFLSKVLAFIFDAERDEQEYQFSFGNFAALIGVSLIPINIVLGITNEPTYFYMLCIGVFVVVLLVLASYFQGFVTIVRGHSHNVFHFFLYLCTFEIIPALLVAKLLHDLCS